MKVRKRSIDSCGEYEFLNTSTNACQDCVRCPPGLELDKECGWGEGQQAVCRECPAGSYQDGSDFYCSPCSYCKNREIIQTCAASHNTKCGGCKPWYIFNERIKMCVPCKPADNCDPPQGLATTARTGPLKSLTPSPGNITATVAIATSDKTTAVLLLNRVNTGTRGPAEMLPGSSHNVTSLKTNSSKIPSSIVSVIIFVVLSLTLLILGLCIFQRRAEPGSCSQILLGTCRERRREPQPRKELTSNSTNKEVQTNLLAVEYNVRDENTLTHITRKGQTSESSGSSSLISEDTLIDSQTPSSQSSAHHSREQIAGIATYSITFTNEERQAYSAEIHKISDELEARQFETLVSYVWSAVENFTECDKEAAKSFLDLQRILDQLREYCMTQPCILVIGLRVVRRFDLAERLFEVTKCTHHPNICKTEIPFRRQGTTN
ncbi:Tumor necrosis factor receptor superfamily member EDAR [Holothuria leucospilota]|uniref:Tumor necrosis factor receptor superfamily member EDAR n=1 Tax=Holothuria leucospilota TaxID=206669 RepID=A0A9Q1BKJ9_HOLLE|nr:Tumor necrosis factor receptor superfamily member EDAR [Holothuria leucospilota]